MMGPLNLEFINKFPILIYTIELEFLNFIIIIQQVIQHPSILSW